MIRINKYFIILILASFLFAIFTGGTLPFYVFYLLLYIYIFSYIYIIFQKYFVSVEVKIEDTIYKSGDFMECLTMVKCSTILPAPYVIIKSMSYKVSESGYIGEIVNITREEDCWIRNVIKFNNRGIYDLGTIELEIKDIFHIYTLNKIIDCKAKVKVYPKVYDIKKMPLGGKDIYQQVIDLKSRNEDVFTIKDVRKYIEGDNLKKVHWKVSAKHGSLFVKNSDNISGEEFAIFLDMNKYNLSLDKNGQQEEDMVDLCASIAAFMQAKGICTKIFINCLLERRINAGSKEQFDVLMDFFLNQYSDGETDFGEFLNKNFYKLQRNIRIGIITSQIDSSFCNNISRIINYGYTLTLFYTDLKESSESNINYLNSIGVACIKISNMLHSVKDR